MAVIIFQIITSPENSKTAIDALSLVTMNHITVTSFAPQRVLIIIEGTV